MKFRPKSEDTRNFVKLKDGESIVGVFRGELYEFKKHWADNRSTLCEGVESCVLCKAGQKPTFRFRANFLVKEGKDEYVAKVLEQGWTFYGLLRTLNEGDYDLEKYVMKITRNGTGLTTSYSVIPAPNGLVSSETEKKLKDVVLNDLGHITEGENEPAEPPPHGDEDIPF